MFVAGLIAVGTLGMLCPACTGQREGKSTPAKKEAAVAAAATPPSSTPAVPALLPLDTIFPDGPYGAALRRGRALFLYTPDSLPQYAQSKLRCASCHLDEGRRPNAIPLVGIYARYPHYADRTQKIQTVEDRTNNCFVRSLAGRPLPLDSREMNEIVAYLAHMSRNIPVGTHVKGEGLPKLERLPSSTSRGAQVYAAQCARCHGANGEGIPPVPPLWGDHSFGIGASMAREERFTSFVKHNMPFDKPGTLSNQDAFDVAAYVTSQHRPNTANKANDWLAGGAPYDVPYATQGHVAYKPAH